MKFGYVVSIAMVISAGTGIGTNYVLNSGTIELDTMSIKSITGIGAAPRERYFRSDHYYYCQRHFGMKSSRRSAADKAEACECFDEEAQQLSTSELSDFQWALRSQYADLSKQLPSRIKEYRGLVGGTYFSANYSSLSDNLLNKCDAEIKFGEKREGT